MLQAQVSEPKRWERTLTHKKAENELHRLTQPLVPLAPNCTPALGWEGTWTSLEPWKKREKGESELCVNSLTLVLFLCYNCIHMYDFEETWKTPSHGAASSPEAQYQ